MFAIDVDAEYEDSSSESEETQDAGLDPFIAKIFADLEFYIHTGETKKETELKEQLKMCNEELLEFKQKNDKLQKNVKTDTMLIDQKDKIINYYQPTPCCKKIRRQKCGGSLRFARLRMEQGLSAHDTDCVNYHPPVVSPDQENPSSDADLGLAKVDRDYFPENQEENQEKNPNENQEENQEENPEENQEENPSDVDLGLAKVDREDDGSVVRRRRNVDHDRESLHSPIESEPCQHECCEPERRDH
jgi:hypothetical protein